MAPHLKRFMLSLGISAGTMEAEEYVDTAVRQLELLPPETVIERLTGDGDGRTLVAPKWSRDKLRVLGSIDKLMAARDTWQGRLFE